MVKRFICFSNQVSEWGRNLISDFDREMIVGAKQGDLNLSVTTQRFAKAQLGRNLKEMVTKMKSKD